LTKKTLIYFFSERPTFYVKLAQLEIAILLKDYPNHYNDEKIQEVTNTKFMIIRAP